MASRAPDKRIILGIVILAGFLVAIFTFNSYFKNKDTTTVCEACDTCSWNVSIFDLVPLLVTLGVMIGAGMYYLMSKKVEIKENSLKKNTETILKLLNKDERKVIDLLIENRGKILQSEFTRLPDMNKVKSHRTIKKLQMRGVIEIQKYGKTNIVNLNNDIKGGLS